LNPENHEMLSEIITYLGLNTDTTSDQYAEKLGGLTRQEIISLMKSFNSPRGSSFPLGVFEAT